MIVFTQWSLLKFNARDIINDQVCHLQKIIAELRWVSGSAIDIAVSDIAVSVIAEHL